MAIKVIAQRRVLKIGKNPGVKKFVMRPDLYIPIQEKKVFAEASTHSGISAGVIKAAWDAAGEVLRTWATEGHSIPLPGLGTMRFGVRSKAVENLEDVKTNLITTRRIVFTPSVEVKDELKNTSIQITCLDEDGNVLKRVTSGDSGEIEDSENENGNENEQNQQNQEQNQPTTYALTINTSGSGSASVTKDGNAVTSGASLNEDDEVEISITPASGQVPTATVNGSEIELTESDGVYTGNFAMPGEPSTLVINTGSTQSQGSPQGGDAPGEGD